MKKQICTILAVLLCAVMFLSACGSNSSTPAPSTSVPDGSTSETPAGKIKIGASFGSSGDVFDRILYEGMQQFMDENESKVDFQMLNALGDTNVQLTNVDQLIASGIDVLILWPYDVNALTPAVEKANEKGIPVVCVNTKTTGGEFVYVGSDDVSAGRIQGEWLAENLPENASYCYFMGPIGHSGQIGRKQGLEEVLAEKRPDVTKLAEQTGNWQRDKAMDIANDWMKSFPEVTAFVSQNDNMALGIIEALRSANKMDDIIVVGTDATEEACGSIKNDELAMSVYQNAWEQGSKSAEIAYKTALGEWDGTDYEIPFEAVDAANVDEYIAMYESMK